MSPPPSPLDVKKRVSPGSRRRWFAATLVVGGLFMYYVFPPVVRHLYADHGHEDQHLVFWVVFSSFLSPALFPVLQFKNFMTLVLFPALGLDGLESQLTYSVGRALLTPAAPFDPRAVPPPPDYDSLKYWAFHPGLYLTDASASVVAGGVPALPKKICSAFYLHPSTWYTSASWNAPALHSVTAYLADDAIGPQHIGAFNVACRLFAPRFRQMAAAGFLQPRGLEDDNSKRALELAYSDVRAAFLHMMEKHHKGEPIFIVGHSQGSVIGNKLVKEFFATPGAKYAGYLGAAYLVGWTVFDSEYPRGGGVEICSKRDAVNCVISWRTFGRGANVKAFLHVEPPTPQSKPICVNPLNWEAGPNTSYAGRELNTGGLDVMHYLSMFYYLIGYKTPKARVSPPALIPGITDAQCQDGHLFVENPTHYGYGWGPLPFNAWTFASFPGRNLHTYDFNFFFNNVRGNVLERAENWYRIKAVPKPELGEGEEQKRRVK